MNRKHQDNHKNCNEENHSKHLVSRRAFGTALGGGLLLAGCSKKKKQMNIGKRVIILGMDGLDPFILKKYMAEGILPNFSALAKQGCSLPLATSNPPQSPVSWTCIATGMNPGFHGVFDFLKRDPRHYSIALTINTPKGTKGGTPNFIRPFKKETFWETAAKAGIEATVLRWPLTFPAKGETTLLSGLGTPDIRGYLGDYSLYTQAKFQEDDEKKRHSVDLIAEKNGFKSNIRGPAKSRTEFVEIPFHIQQKENQVELLIEDKRITLKENNWSDLLSFSFSVGLFKRIKGVGQFFLLRTADPFILYLSPIAVDPVDPVFPIGNPPGFTRGLQKEIGPFHTLGMPEDVNAIKRGALPPGGFLSSCSDIITEQEKMLYSALSKQKDGILSFVFFTSDRIQHMFWAGLDADHPFNRLKEQSGTPFSYTGMFHKLGENPVRNLYKRLDKILGNVQKSLSSNDLLFVLSDHGFTTYRRSFHVNNFLAQEGYLSLAPGGNKSIIFPNVNWRETTAYSMGFAGIYFNLAGRELHGMVSEKKATEMEREIKKKLLDLKDPETGINPVRNVWTRKEIYKGPEAVYSPDLILGLERGYRFSDETALGGTAKATGGGCTGETGTGDAAGGDAAGGGAAGGDAAGGGAAGGGAAGKVAEGKARPGLFSDNILPWTGTHLVDPDLVPGVLLSNRPLKTGNPSVFDIAPTVLSALGLKPHKNMQGKNIL